MHFCYSTLDNMLPKVIEVRRHFFIKKCNIKNTFRKNLAELFVWWLFRFCQKAYFYTENFQLFGLLTMLFIFNLFAKAFDGILQSFLGWNLEHYLNNFVVFLPAVKAMPDKTQIESDNYACLMDILGIAREETKDLETTVAPVFGFKIDTILFARSLSRDKIHKRYELSATKLNKQNITLVKAVTLTGFQSFVPRWCA